MDTSPTERLRQIFENTLDSGLYHTRNEYNDNEAFIFHVPNEKMHIHSFYWEITH